MSYTTPTRWHNATKKQHRCEWCGERIVIGERYATWRSFYDAPMTTRVHEECHEDMLDALEPGETFMPWSAERPPKPAQTTSGEGLVPGPDAARADERPYYVHRNSGGAVFVKEGEFFEQQGGLTEEWGKHWTVVQACSIEHARAIGELTLPDKAAAQTPGGEGHARS